MKSFKQHLRSYKVGAHLRKMGVKLCSDCYGYGGHSLGSEKNAKKNDTNCPTCKGSGWQHIREDVNVDEVNKFFIELVEGTEPKTCSTCGDEYNARRHKKGLATQCDDCGHAEEEERGVRRHVGTITGIGKQAITNIIKNPSKTMTAAVKQYNINPRSTGTGSTFSNVGVSGEREKKNAPKN